VGVEASRGEFLVFLDGDDALLPWALDIYRHVLDREQPKIILGTMLWFDNELPKVNGSVPEQMKVVAYENLLEKDRPYRASASALVIDREVFIKVKGWTNEAFPMDDLDALIKLFHSGRTVQILGPATVAYRVHAANSVHQVATCAAALRRIMRNERRGGSALGQPTSAKRYAFLGGPALFWVIKACKNGMYTEALRILGAGWPMIMAAAVRRAAVTIKGRRAVQTIGL
jgi:hypothetical protein